MKYKLALTSLLFTTLITASISSVQAATPTPEASSAGDIQQNVKDRIEKVSSDPTVQGLMTAMRSPKFGIIGTLEKVVGSTLQIKTVKDATRVIELDKTAVLLKDNKPILREDVELNSPIVVMGFHNEDETFLGRRLVVADDTIFPDKRLTILGKINTVTTKAINVATRVNGQMQNADIKISTKTAYYNLLDTTIKRTDLKPSDAIVAIIPGDDASASATRVYSLSAKAIPTPSPVDEKLLK